MFCGTYTALVTPFSNGQLDEKAFAALVERQVAAGVEGIVPCGTTGESPTLSEQEHRRVVELAIQISKKRVQVIAGSGTASTDKTIHFCKMARELGADGVLVVSPYYNKPTQEGLFQHHAAIAAEVSIPTVLYNIPGRTGVDMSLTTLERLAKFKDIVAVKEATGNVLRAQQIVSTLRDRFRVLCGDDALTVPMMSVGADGVVSVTSNLFPKAVKRCVDKMRTKNWDAARQEHLRLLPVHESMFVETNPGPIKYAMAQSGLIQPEIRLPLTWPEEQSQKRIARSVSEFGGYDAD